VAPERSVVAPRGRGGGAESTVGDAGAHQALVFHRTGFRKPLTCAKAPSEG
jgi:hypothetical protein